MIIILKNSDYDKYKFLKEKNFVITNLEGGLHPRKSKYEDRTLSIILSVFAVMFLVMVSTFTAVMDLTKLHPLILVMLYIILGILIIFKLVSVIQYNIYERVRERTLSGDNNVSFDLNSVWNIRPGGISDVELNDCTTIKVKYRSNAVILRGIMKGTVDCEDNADYVHYNTMQKLVDICMCEHMELEIISIPYYIDNDYIWDMEADKINSSSYLGTNYTKIRTALYNQVYEYTKTNSKINAQYYILKSTPLTRLSVEDVASEIQKLNKYSCMNISGINSSEFKNLLENYYGISVSIEDIMGMTTILTTDLGECRIISYKDSNGNEINVSTLYEYNIPDIFTKSITSSLVDIYDNKNNISNFEGLDVKENEIGNFLFNVESIFDRDFI